MTAYIALTLVCLRRLSGILMFRDKYKVHYVILIHGTLYKL